MPTDPTAHNKSDPEPTPTDQESSVPEPPSPEAMEELSRQQGLITDEWTGDGPDSADEATEAGEGGRLEVARRRLRQDAWKARKAPVPFWGTDAGC